MVNSIFTAKQMFQLFNPLHNNLIHFQCRSRLTKTTSIVIGLLFLISKVVFVFTDLFGLDFRELEQNHYPICPFPGNGEFPQGWVFAHTKNRGKLSRIRHGTSPQICPAVCLDN